MEIVANLFSFTGHLIDLCAGFAFNEKSKLILFSIVSSLCSLLAMFLLHSTAGCISVTVTIIRLYIIYQKDKYGWNIDWAVVVFIVGYAAIFLDNDLAVAFLMFFGNMVTFLSKWFCHKAQYLRIGACIANLIFIFPNYLIHNFSVIPFHVFNMITILLAYIKWYKQDKK